MFFLCGVVLLVELRVCGLWSVGCALYVRNMICVGWYVSINLLQLVSG